jgi:pilus assembly protein Flp/PilA
MQLIKRIIARLRLDEGATMVEYGLMVALIAVVAMVGAGVLGVNINTLFNSIAGSL